MIPTHPASVNEFLQRKLNGKPWNCDIDISAGVRKQSASSGQEGAEDHAVGDLGTGCGAAIIRAWPVDHLDLDILGS
jgi:hypothetical protein